jgi:hypothetical protein
VACLLDVLAELYDQLDMTTTLLKVFSQIILASGSNQLYLLFNIIHILIDILHLSLPLNWVYLAFQDLLFLRLVIFLIVLPTLGIEAGLGFLQYDLLVYFAGLLARIHEGIIIHFLSFNTACIDSEDMVLEIATRLLTVIIVLTVL